MFDFDATTCRTDVVDLSRVTVRVRDAKGKEVTSAPLSELSLFKDASIERIRFVRTDEEDALPAAWVLLGGKPAGADAEGVVYTNAASVEVSARIADPLMYSALRDAAWFEQYPISAVLDGAAQTLDPATLTGSGRGSRRRFEAPCLPHGMRRAAIRQAQPLTVRAWLPSSKSPCSRVLQRFGGNRPYEPRRGLGAGQG